MLSTEPGNSPNFHRKIRAEFPLPALEQVRRRFSERMEDTEPVMQQLVRVVMPYFHSPKSGQGLSAQPDRGTSWLASRLRSVQIDEDSLESMQAPPDPLSPQSWESSAEIHQQMAAEEG